MSDNPLLEAPDTEIWVSVNHVCERLSLSRRSVRNLIEQGDLEAIHFNNYYRISNISVERFIEDSRLAS